MSDKWEVKSVTKSGDGFNIRIGPVDSNEGFEFVLAGAIFASFTGDLLDISVFEAGFWKSLGVLLVWTCISALLPIPSMVAAAAIVFVYLIKWFVF